MSIDNDALLSIFRSYFSWKTSLRISDSLWYLNFWSKDILIDTADLIRGDWLPVSQSPGELLFKSLFSVARMQSHRISEWYSPDLHPGPVPRGLSYFHPFDRRSIRWRPSSIRSLVRCREMDRRIQVIGGRGTRSL